MILLSVRTLPPEEREWLPPLEVRMHLQIGAEVRLLDVGRALLPWVRIDEVTDAGYIGHIADGASIAFTADNIIEV